ncbi:MAG: ornithine cyclodeaminase family protein [Gammaproteobacteria bacterium]|nr:ornithine cyclodeaminase family protein [Gammaproteobacteria bacterium]MDH4253481.1 ornithine cyclodeaminase family protein [Gammaproteobacteria bacterium]MDH5309714.1 ornithine cyclodeaminase family protein [Gammaproteobacteria bacterium]
MHLIDAAELAERLPYGALVDALERAFRNGAEVPVRTHYSVDARGQARATLLLMPAWRAGGSLGVKIATVFPDNAKKGLGAVHASYLLMDGDTGAPLALMDGSELTLRRTACASALASRCLSREDSKTLLMVGTGRLAPHLVRAHSTVRGLERILLWGRRPAAAHELAEALQPIAAEIAVVTNLERGVGEADIVSCATLASTPLVRGAWLLPGQHVDLVGAFTPAMREADGEALRRARVAVDTYAGGLEEAGDILLAIDDGLIGRDHVLAELAELVRGDKVLRRNSSDITLFKSVGTALEDLAAAELVLARSN